MSKERYLNKIARITTVTSAVVSIVACNEANYKIPTEPTIDKTNHALNLSSSEIQEMQNEQTLNYLVASFKTPTIIPEQSATMEPTAFSNKKTAISEKVSSEQLTKYKAELPQVFAKIESNPQDFNVTQDEEDLFIYYPIYRAVEDKYGVDWFTLWIIHSDESTVSRNPAAFVENSRHFGAMQRSPESHPQIDVDKYFQGMEYLNLIPTRNITDPEEIVYAGASIAENTQITGSLQGALNKYSASGPAATRYQRYQILKAVFSAE